MGRAGCQLLYHVIMTSQFYTCDSTVYKSILQVNAIKSCLTKKYCLQQLQRPSWLQQLGKRCNTETSFLGVPIVCMSYLTRCIQHADGQTVIGNVCGIHQLHYWGFRSAAIFGERWHFSAASISSSEIQGVGKCFKLNSHLQNLHMAFVSSARTGWIHALVGFFFPDFTVSIAKILTPD